MLPDDVLSEHGLTREQIIASPAAAPVQAVIRRMIHEGLGLLDRPLRLPKRALAAALPAVLASRDLRRGLPFPPHRGLGDRLAVMLAGVTGRITFR